MIVIVDYGMGNLGSVLNMLKKAGAGAVISSIASVIETGEKLILPGVGSFDNGMKSLADRGLVEVLNRKVLGDRTPILGICLGMQLFSRRSEEGSLPGLGWIDADTTKFRFDGGRGKRAIPHMGWNVIRTTKTHPLLQGFEEPPRFYFVHSYHVQCRDAADVLATCEYGIEFTAAVRRDNIMGTQFHPEKSHKFGLRVLGNFAAMR
jgi:imidazole glycerol-phosphate synthase subunit HisH